MALEEVQKSAVGVAIIATIKEDGTAVDVSTATTLQLVFQKPGDTLVTKTAVLNTTGTDGKIKYTTIAGDLDTVGTWHVQANIAFSGGFSGLSDVQSFRVLPNLA